MDELSFAGLITLLVALPLIPGYIIRIVRQRRAYVPSSRRAPRTDHLPCIINTIGVIVTESILMMVILLVVFALASLAVTIVFNAPSAAAGIRYIAYTLFALIVILPVAAYLVTRDLTSSLVSVAALTFLGVVAILIIRSTGNDSPMVLGFALLCYAVPAAFIWFRS